MRIVSLVPSLTKTICDFGLQSHVVGCTIFCVDPPSLARTSTRIGGTKNPNIDAIISLDPTHILVNEEENKPADIDILSSKFNVLNTFPKSPRDVPDLLMKMGVFLECPQVAMKMAAKLSESLSQLDQQPEVFRSLGKRFAYLIWRDPWMAVSEDTYISRFLELFGMENVIKSSSRYPVVEPKDIDALAPDVLFMSSEPWPFRKRDAAAWRQITGASAAKIFWIDGQAMSWYGTTTLEVLDEVGELKMKKDAGTVAKKFLKSL